VRHAAEATTRRKAMNTTVEHPELRELDHRRGDGFDVTLLWSARTGKVYVAVEDARASESFRIAVDPARALDAFHHPYAYGGVGRHEATRPETDAAALPNAG
jgi:hypothetical protein